MYQYRAIAMKMMGFTDTGDDAWFDQVPDHRRDALSTVAEMVYRAGGRLISRQAIAAVIQNADAVHDLRQTLLPDVT